jgi:hypothetical protein
MAEHQPTPDLPTLQALDRRSYLLDVSLDRTGGVLLVTCEIGQLAPVVHLKKLLKTEVGLCATFPYTQ